MFGDSVPLASDSLADLRLENIDFEWVTECKKISLLKKAIRLIEDDGKN